MNLLSTKKSTGRLIFRWTTFKGLAAVLIFLLLAVLVEYIVVLYGMKLGVKDENFLVWSLQLPGTGWNVTVAASSLYHLVPVAVIVSLVSSWVYLTKHVRAKPPERWKGKVKPTSRRGEKKGFRGMASKIRDFFGRVKSGLLKIRGIAGIWEKVDLARATIKSALTVLLVFGALVLLVSLLAYPQLIHWTVLGAYKNNHPLLGFVKSVGDLGGSLVETLAPIGWICSATNNVLLSIAPGFRGFASNLGGLTRPLVELDNVGKYLVFQNVAAWVSALTALFFGTIRRKSYRRKRGRKV